MLFGIALSAQDLAEQSRLASKAMAQGRFREAAALYQKAGLRLQLALAWFSAEDYPRAEAELLQLTRQQPTLQPAWFLLGLTYQKRSQPFKAIAPLRTALTLKATDENARFELADAYLNTGQSALAAREFRAVTERNPSHAKAWQGVGASYLSMASVASKSLERNAPESGFRYALLAESRARQRRWPEAFVLYRRAQALGVLGLHRSIAAIYAETGHPDWAATEAALEGPQASQDWQATLQRYEGQATPEALYWTARAATALFEQTLTKLQTLPDSGALHELRAEANELQGRRAEAVAEWRTALRLAPKDPRVEGSLGRALWRNREYDEALPILSRMAAHQPHVAEWNYLLGDLYYRLEQAPKAVALLEAALRREPGQVAAHAVLGRVYMQLGEPGKALPHLQAAFSTDEDGSLYYQLGLAYRRTGQETLAQAMFARQREAQTQSEAAAELPLTPPAVR